MEDRPIRVVIVDDHPVVVDGVITALRPHDDIIVAGTGSSAGEAVDLARRLRPEVVLVDIHMPGGTGVEAIRRIAEASPETRCVVLTMDDDDDALFAAMQAGARGYLLKGSRGPDIARALRAAAHGELVFGPEVSSRVAALFMSPRPPAGRDAFPDLDERELVLLDLLAAGADNAAIGRDLGLAAKTVRNHISLLLTKLGVPDRVAAVLVARQAGLGRRPLDP